MIYKKIPLIAVCLVFIFAFSLPSTMSSYAQSESMAFTFYTKWGSPGEGDGQFDGQNDVDFYNGKVYVPDYANHRIQVFDPEGKFLAKFGEGGEDDGQFHKASALSIDNEGNLYIADQFNYRIQKFTNDGQFVKKWGSEVRMTVSSCTPMSQQMTLRESCL